VTLRRNRDTGPTRAVRALVWDREGGCCAACGHGLGYGSWYSIQHRVARGTGGINNSPENLVLLCGSSTSCGCHRLCEDRNPEMHDRGFWLWSTENPALIPVLLWSPYRDEEWSVRWLTAEGTYAAECPERTT
jgi:hypothetical protein